MLISLKLSALLGCHRASFRAMPIGRNGASLPGLSGYPVLQLAAVAWRKLQELNAGPALSIGPSDLAFGFDQGSRKEKSYLHGTGCRDRTSGLDCHSLFVHIQE